MSSRTILSRPRTRIYDANYNIGQGYYKPTLDRLDRKYMGRPMSPPRESNIPRDVEERFERAFAEDDLPSARRRAERTIAEPHAFDFRGGRIARAVEFAENDIDEEVQRIYRDNRWRWTAATLKRIRANKKVSVIDDVGLNSTVNNISSYRMVDRSEKLLDTVGVNENSRRVLDEDISYKRRQQKVSFEDDKDLTKWTPLVREDAESAAMLRAKKSRERIDDLEEEMNALAEKQAMRERRAARLKALVAETAEDNEAQSSVKSVSVRARREKVTAEY